MHSQPIVHTDTVYVKEVWEQDPDAEWGEKTPTQAKERMVKT